MPVLPEIKFFEKFNFPRFGPGAFGRITLLACVAMIVALVLAAVMHDVQLAYIALYSILGIFVFAVIAGGLMVWLFPKHALVDGVPLAQLLDKQQMGEGDVPSAKSLISKPGTPEPVALAPSQGQGTGRQ